MGGTKSREEKLNEAATYNDLASFKKIIEAPPLPLTSSSPSPASVVKPSTSPNEIFTTIDREGNSLIHRAASRGSYDIVEYLLKKSPIIKVSYHQYVICTMDGMWGETAITTDPVYIFVRHANLRSRSPSQNTPLHCVTDAMKKSTLDNNSSGMAGLLKCLELLLEHGADPFARDARSKTPVAHLDDIKTRVKIRPMVVDWYLGGAERISESVRSGKYEGKKPPGVVDAPTNLEKACGALQAGSQAMKATQTLMKDLMAVFDKLYAAGNPTTTTRTPCSPPTPSSSPETITDDFQLVLQILTANENIATSFHFLTSENQQQFLGASTPYAAAHPALFFSETVDKREVRRAKSNLSTLAKPLVYLIVELFNPEQAIRLCKTLIVMHRVNIFENWDFYPYTVVHAICEYHVIKQSSITLLKWFLKEYFVNHHHDKPHDDDGEGKKITMEPENFFRVGDTNRDRKGGTSSRTPTNETTPMLALIKERKLSQFTLVADRENDFEQQLVAISGIALLMHYGDNMLRATSKTTKKENALIKSIRCSRAHIVQFLLHEFVVIVGDDGAAEEETSPFHRQVKRLLIEQIPDFDFRKHNKRIQAVLKYALNSDDSEKGAFPLSIALETLAELDTITKSINKWIKSISDESSSTNDGRLKAFRDQNQKVAAATEQQMLILDTLLKSRQLNVISLKSALLTLESLMIVKGREKLLNIWKSKIEGELVKLKYEKRADGEWGFIADKKKRIAAAREHEFGGGDAGAAVPAVKDVDSSLIRAVERAARLRKEAEKLDELLSSSAKPSIGDDHTLVNIPGGVAFGGEGESDVSL